MQRFFFYGTLQRGGLYYRQLRLAERARFLSEDRIAGRLYDCGPWPAALIGESGIIHGELFETIDPQLGAEIDAVEGFDPERPETSEYVRRTIHTTGGILAIAYHYTRPVDDLTPLPSGRWPIR
ncbi:MAG: hypothetical protein CMN72_11080 [Sphingomonas sp.]|nr:hypothetical protein [Sphingomonas sp.]